jgi:hypothetical protein
MISLSGRLRAHRPPACIRVLLAVLPFSGIALTPANVHAQTGGKQDGQHKKLLAHDLAQLQEVFKDKLVTVEVSAGSQKTYHGRILGVRQVLGERFLQLGRPEEGGFAGPSVALISCKTIVAIYQQ